MTESESVALPFGDSAMFWLLDELYTKSFHFASTFLNFLNFFNNLCRIISYIAKAPPIGRAFAWLNYCSTVIMCFPDPISVPSQ